MHRLWAAPPTHPRVFGLADACADEAALVSASAAGQAWTQERLVEALHDSPALSLQLLCALPSDARQPNLRLALTQAVAWAGEELLCAWLYALEGAPSPRAGAVRSGNLHARLVARVARQLATETTLCEADHAWVAGLWHNLGQLELAARHAGYPGPVCDAREAQLAHGEAKQYGKDHGGLLAGEVHGLLDVPLLSEAIELHHAPIEFTTRMPGLVRVLRAVVAALSQSKEGGAHAESLIGVPVARLQEIARDAVQALAVERDAAATAPRLPQVAVRGLLQSAFGDAPPERFLARLHAGCVLLARTSLLLVLRRRGDGLVIDRRVHDQLALKLPIATGGGACWRALRRSERVASDAQDATDWLLARQLNVAAFQCVPWKIEDDEGIAILAGDTVPDASVGWLAAVLDAAMASLRRNEVVRTSVEQQVARARATEVAAARRVAHEISNPLTVIGNYLAILESDEGMKPQTQQMLRQMQTEILRTQRLLSGLGRPGNAPSDASCNPNEVLTEIGALYRDSLLVRQGIRVDMTLADTTPLADIPADALKQVVLNLLLNATEALGAGGWIRLQSSVDANFNGKPWIEIGVEDNGPGISRDGLFLELPDRSSKGGDHAGTGLTVCRTLVEEAGGHLLCRSSARGGTRFTVLLKPLNAA